MGNGVRASTVKGAASNTASPGTSGNRDSEVEVEVYKVVLGPEMRAPWEICNDLGRPPSVAGIGIGSMNAGDV